MRSPLYFFIKVLENSRKDGEIKRILSLLKIKQKGIEIFSAEIYTIPVLESFRLSGTQQIYVTVVSILR